MQLEFRANYQSESVFIVADFERDNNSFSINKVWAVGANSNYFKQTPELLKIAEKWIEENRKEIEKNLND